MQNLPNGIGWMVTPVLNRPLPKHTKWGSADASRTPEELPPKLLPVLKDDVIYRDFLLILFYCNNEKLEPDEMNNSFNYTVNTFLNKKL